MGRKTKMRIQEEGKTILLSKLTSMDEEKLRDFSLKMKKEAPEFSMSHAIETYLEVSETTEAEIMAQIVCSSCKEPIGAIANGWPLCLFKKIKGYYCRNTSCEFYRKFIPVERAEKLASVLALPVAHYALRDTRTCPTSMNKDI